MPAPTTRDYSALVPALSPRGDREARMTAVVDALWPALKDANVSWLGFYLNGPDADEMTLGPRRDKPACSPIGLFGACGRAWKSRRPLIVTDVAKLGEGYIACDPRDKSEVVIPLIDAASGVCWGGFDVDSHEVDAFSPDDVAGLLRVLVHAGLTSPIDAKIETV